MKNPPSTSGLIALLMIDIALSFAYGFLPVDFKSLRSLVDIVQFIAMAATMIYAVRGVINDF